MQLFLGPDEGTDPSIRGREGSSSRHEPFNPDRPLGGRHANGDGHVVERGHTPAGQQVCATVREPLSTHISLVTQVTRPACRRH